MIMCLQLQAGYDKFSKKVEDFLIETDLLLKLLHFIVAEP